MNDWKFIQNQIQLLKLLLCKKGRNGQTLVEYGLILALVAIVTIAVLKTMGNQLKNIFNTITSTLGTVGS